MKKQGYTYFEANPLVMEAHDRSKRGALNEERKRRVREKYIQLLNLVIISALCFFIGRTFIFKDIAPFGTALFAAMLYRRQGSLIGFAVILGGMLSVHIGSYILKYLGAMGLVFVIIYVFDIIRIGRRKFLLAAITAIAVFSANLIYRSLSPGGILLYDYILASLEGAIALALVYVFENVLSAIKIICVYNDKGTVNLSPAREHRVTSPPGLLSVFGPFKTLGQIIKGLEDIGGFHLIFDLLSYGIPENLIVLLFYNEYYLAKSCLQCVVYGIIHDYFPIGADGIDLLQSPIPASHSCCHNNQCRFCHQ
jgi:hypothetical protein